MDANLTALALTALDLMGPGASDDRLAEAFGDHESAALGAAYLAAFAIQDLALQRGESVASTISHLRVALGEKGQGDDGLAGVREPRRPGPKPAM